MREDAATEADLVRAGYRDRLLTELAQNAADAAAKTGVAGRLTVRLDGRSLHIANNGAPLDLSGVHALTALRASGKGASRDGGRALRSSSVGAGSAGGPGSAGESGLAGDSRLAGTVGRFGVGFTAVLTVTDEVELRSVSGGLRFSRLETLAALRDNGIQLPGGEGITPPTLRLVWPMSVSPEAGADTEIVLHLRDDVDPTHLLAAMRAEAVDLLLELPALQSIRIEAGEFTSAIKELDGDRSGLQEITVDTPDGRQAWWQFRTERSRWLLLLRNGRPVPAAPDVLRAPTRSDEELSLPALLIADIAMQPDRRRLLPGAHLAELLHGYADFAHALPPRDRLTLVPTPGFARSEPDALLREAAIRELQQHPWLPVVGTPPTAADPRDNDALAAGSDTGGPLAQAAVGSLAAAGGIADLSAADVETRGTTADFDASLDWPADLGRAAGRGSGRGAVAVPTRASVFAGLTEELAGLLDDVVGPLVLPELSGRGQLEALGVLDVHRVGLARLAELSSGLERAPKWWHSLYAALEPFVVDPLSAEELGALAVPLADGRLVTGPRTVVLDDQLEVAIPVHWARLVHPEAAHPLLARLGARSATAEDLLSDPGLEAELTDRPDDPDTIDAVLRLAAHADPDVLPAWLGQLELPDSTGELLPADELLLPGAPLREVLVEDSPFGTVATDLVDRYGAAALQAIGVGWDFGVVVEADPTGPDHHLDDEEQWWSTLSEDPPELAAVRDLDLVDDAAWPKALQQLASGDRTRRIVADRTGYTAWWLRRHARIDGRPLGVFRHPADTEFADLLPVFEAPGLAHRDIDALRAVLATPDTLTPDLAAALLDALADPAKTPTPETISRTHRLLAAAVAAEHIDVTDLDLPDRVRALSGAVVHPDDALVLDQPCFGLAIPPDRLVVGDIPTAPSLATLLDLPLVSESITAEILSTGRPTTWSAEPLGIVVRQLFTLPPQEGPLVIHHNLRIRLTGAYEATLEVPWWTTGTTTHLNAPQFHP